MSTPAEATEVVAPTGQRELSYGRAITEALQLALRADPRVVVLGEDIAGGAGKGAPHEGAMGGSFGVTKGLLEEFGPRRVRDTPISEAGFVGAAVGAAMSGLRPVVDVMWASFTPYCWDQIVNQAAKMRYMSGGQARVPLVLRMAIGAGLRAAGQHSDTFYGMFSTVPGLKVVAPATPADAKGLLLGAIAEDDPVVFLEHMDLYRATGPVPEGSEPFPLGRAEVVRSGRDVTVVTVGESRRAALVAADDLAAEGVETEIVDLRTLRPLDRGTVLASVARTGRLVVVEEAPPQCSVASEVLAVVAEAGHGTLRTAPVRVNAASSPAPFSPPLEDAYLPSADRVGAAIRGVVG